MAKNRPKRPPDPRALARLMPGGPDRSNKAPDHMRGNLEFREIAPPQATVDRFQRDWAQAGTQWHTLRCFDGPDGLTVLVTREHGMYHLSIAHPARMPTWHEISSAWYQLIPGADKRHGALILPPTKAYVNMHPYCMQVCEIDPPRAEDPPTPAR